MEADIVIIGAGLSGLSSLSYINENYEKLKIILLEARERCGGKTCSVSIDSTDDKYLDVGGQWVGLKHSKLLELVKEFNLELEEQFYSDIDEIKYPYHSTLTSLVNFPLNYLSKDDTDEIKKFTNFVDEFALNMNLEYPWLTPNAEELDNQSVTDFVVANITAKNAQDEILLFAQTV